tara:strand:- start:2274 stop:2420 length:147 start_codon:yes stop_codon:yes gene_type:complete
MGDQPLPVIFIQFGFEVLVASPKNLPSASQPKPLSNEAADLPKGDREF